MADAPFEMEKANRWFAIELNNRAWALVEAESRSDDDDEGMIHAAYAALWHWQEVGTALNRQRAECLVATAYAAAGRTEPALHHGQRCVELSETNGAEQSAFDRATAYACAARANALAGHGERAAALREMAAAAAESFQHPDEKEVFAKLYPAD